MAQQVFVCNEIEMKDGDVRIVRQDRIEVGVYRLTMDELREYRPDLFT